MEKTFFYNLKEKIMKKQISLLLTIAMILSMVLPIMVFTTSAEEAAIEVESYYDLTDALETADAGEIIKLVDDISTDETVKINKAVIIDGNGHSYEYTGNKEAFNIETAQGVVPVIKNLKLTSTAAAASVSNAKFVDCDFTTVKNMFTYTYTNNNSLTIDGGKYTVDGTNVDNVFNVLSEGGSIDILDGVFNATGLIVSNQNNITFNVYNGYFGAAGNFVISMANGTANIYGGYFKNTAVLKNPADKGSYRALITAGKASINVYGGIIDANNVAVRGDNGGKIHMYGGVYSGVRNGQDAYVTAGDCVRYEPTNMSIIIDNKVTPSFPQSLNTVDGVARGASNLDNLPKFVGSAVRLVSGSYGIRFTSNVSRNFLATIDSVKDDGTELSYGTIIVPKDHVDGKGITYITEESLRGAGLKAGESTGYMKIEGADGVTKNADGSVTIRAALINLYASNYKREFYAVSYVSYVRNGHNVVVYGLSQTDDARSIAGVAAAALADVKNEKKGAYKYAVSGGNYSPYTDAQRLILEGYTK